MVAMQACLAKRPIALLFTSMVTGFSVSVWLPNQLAFADRFDPSKVIWCSGIRYYGACPTPAPASEPPIYSNQNLRRALEYLAQREFEPAIRELERAERQFPNDLAVSEKLKEARLAYAQDLRNAAAAQHEAGNFSLAVEGFNRAAGI